MEFSVSVQVEDETQISADVGPNPAEEDEKQKEKSSWAPRQCVVSITVLWIKKEIKLPLIHQLLSRKKWNS